MPATIPIEQIEPGQRLRDISEAQVQSLIASIADVGLLNPITVYVRTVMRSGEAVEGYGLVAGAHRLEACARLGMVDIPAHVVELNDLQRQIAECDENLCATTLSKAERAIFTKRRKDAYEALHPETKHGSPGVSRQVGDTGDRAEADRFTADTASKTGQSERSVQRDAERGQEVSLAALALVKGTLLDSGSYLDKLKKVEKNEQVATVRRDLAQAKKPKVSSAKSKVDSDIKQRAAKEVAEVIAEYVPGEWWDAVKANLYAAGASNIAHELTNLVGQAVLDRRAA
jgi:ParB family transcriptional regulator, chromosome partitioning protein